MGRDMRVLSLKLEGRRSPPAFLLSWPDILARFSRTGTPNLFCPDLFLISCTNVLSLESPDGDNNSTIGAIVFF